jgi:NADH:ubiquinone oxidoreductase subunit H
MGHYAGQIDFDFFRKRSHLGAVLLTFYSCNYDVAVINVITTIFLINAGASNAKIVKSQQTKNKRNASDATESTAI